MNPHNPRWNMAGLRALIAFDSVHKARAAARAFEAAHGLPTAHLTGVTVPGGAQIQFVRIRDPEDLVHFRKPFSYIEFTYPASTECIEHMRALCTGPHPEFVS